MRATLVSFALLALCAVKSPAAVCTGEDPCKACKDCSACAYCNSGKGSCGTIRSQNAEQERKRLAKKKPPPKK